MRQFIIFLALMGAFAVGAVRYADQMAKPGAANALAANARSANEPVSSGPRSVTLRSDRSGHFQVQAHVDGRPVDFLLDTGASMIALRESAAARLGIHPVARDYTVKLQTANGVGRAARVRLNRVEVNGITVRDVDAFVVPDDALAVNLLGMSFLRRVKWTHDHGRLVLEQ
jgi:aspartyl protease family protein